MFFDMGPLEMLTIFVIAIVVLGPDKLPKVISDMSTFIRKVRSLSDNAQVEIRRELGPEISDLNLRDLHPRALTEKVLSRAEDEAGLREFAAAFSLEEPADIGDSSPPLMLAKAAQTLSEGEQRRHS
ncbi:Sec-independent protein translocase TatB [Streptomyces sp. NPDC002922]|uniref:Sec-independent protein translocase TatB n=1 Tax=Streptomyces sp. NPDC002922 TaxID=3154439 RepID=UPI0033B070D4